MHRFLGFRHGPPAVVKALPVLSNIKLESLFGGYLGDFACDVTVSRYRLTKTDKSGNPEFESMSLLYLPEVGKAKYNISKHSNITLSTMTTDTGGHTYKYINFNIKKMKPEDFGLYSFAFHLNPLSEQSKDPTGTKGYFLGIYAMTQTQVLLVGQNSLRTSLSVYIRSCTPGSGQGQRDMIGVQRGEVTCMRCTAYGEFIVYIIYLI